MTDLLLLLSAGVLGGYQSPETHLFAQWLEFHMLDKR